MMRERKQSMIIGEKSKKMNNELKLNVDEQQDDTKHLKEYCNIDDIEPL